MSRASRPKLGGLVRTNRRLLGAGVVPVAIAASSLLVWQSSYAAFSAKTSNPSNDWSAGTVTLSDSQGGPGSGTALWSSASALKPGSTGTKCIQVTYAGNLAAKVRMYVGGGGLTGTGLGSSLRFTVHEGTVGSQAGCGDFGGTVTRLYN